MVDDDTFNLIALKSIMKVAEENLFKKLSKKKYGNLVKGFPEEQSIMKKVDTRNNGQEAL